MNTTDEQQDGGIQVGREDVVQILLLDVFGQDRIENPCILYYSVQYRQRFDQMFPVVFLCQVGSDNCMACPFQHGEGFFQPFGIARSQDDGSPHPGTFDGNGSPDSR